MGRCFPAHFLKKYKEVFRMDKKSTKNNLEYFWMYYKWLTIAGIIVVILAVYFGFSEKRKCFICDAY